MRILFRDISDLQALIDTAHCAKQVKNIVPIASVTIEVHASVEKIAKMFKVIDYVLPQNSYHDEATYQHILSLRSITADSTLYLSSAELIWRSIRHIDQRLKNLSLTCQISVEDLSIEANKEGKSELLVIAPGSLKEDLAKADEWRSFIEKLPATLKREVWVTDKATLDILNNIGVRAILINLSEDFAQCIRRLNSATRYIGSDKELDMLASISHLFGIIIHNGTSTREVYYNHPKGSLLRAALLQSSEKLDSLVETFLGQDTRYFLSAGRAQISAFVICCNEESNISRCLESLLWCDEIVLIDSGSTDKTLEIAKKYGVKIISHPWRGFVQQKALGLQSCKGEWVLNLDADEEVSLELKGEILKVIHDQLGSNIAGYDLLRVVYHLGRWWEKGGWFPEYRLRLVRRKAARWGGAEPHEKALVDGKTVRLQNPIYHYTYKDTQDQIDTVLRHASVAAETINKSGAHVSYLSLIFNPIARFLKFYLLRKGFLEGVDGFRVAIIEAYGTFYKYRRAIELQER